MTTLVPVTYKGGVYRHDEIMDLIDDLGGYVVQKHVMAQDVVLQSFVPRDDIAAIFMHPISNNEAILILL